MKNKKIFSEENWESMKSKIKEYEQKNLKVEILVPDHRNLLKRIKREDDYKFILNEGEYDGIKRYFLQTRKGQVFPVMQSRFHTDYEIGSIKQGYGFKVIECRECSEEPFYNRKDDEYYCPCNS